MSNRRKFDIEEAIALADEGLSNYAIADRLGTDESSIRRAFRSVGYERHLIPTHLEDRFEFSMDTPIYVEGDWAITADWHVPLYDPDLVNQFITDARDYGITNLAVAGDFFNFDSLSRFDPKQTEAGLEREIEEAVAVMRVLTQTFDRIVFLWGNHDARLHKALGYKFQFKEAMRLVFGELKDQGLEKIEFTNLDHMWLLSGDTEWYICHPANYTRVPLSTARQLSAKYNANVLTAHSHHCAVGYAVDGLKVVGECGGLFDASKTAYLQRSTTHPQWTNGYAFLIEGKLLVKSPGWSAI